MMNHKKAMKGDDMKTKSSKAILMLLLSALIITGCAPAIADTPGKPTVAPTEVLGNTPDPTEVREEASEDFEAQPVERVEGWVGTVADLPAGNQLGQTFEREDGERFELGMPTDAVRERVVEARSEGTQIKIWGTLRYGVPATEVRTIVVERLEFLSETPPDEGEAVEGWTGSVYQLPPGNQFGRAFVRDDGERYGIGTDDKAIREQIDDAAWEGAHIKIWGTPYTGVPATDARHIQVDRLEVLSKVASEPRLLSPFAEVSSSSQLPSDQYGTYGPYAAIDGSKETAWVEGVAGPGTGQWIQLTFPGAIELHSLGFDVGFDKNTDLFDKNNRIKKATLVFSNGEETSISFQDTRGLQEVLMVRAPRPNVKTTSVKVIIDEVYPGTRYDDTCLAEVEVWGVVR
jgi:hypothetical protein